MARINTVNAVRLANSLTDLDRAPIAASDEETIFPLGLKQLGTECSALWICEIPGRKKKHMCLWALTDLEDLKRGCIIPHESIIADRVRPMINRRLVEDKEISPVVLCYRANRKISELLEYGRFGDLPDEDFEWHWGLRVWKVKDRETVERFQSAFREINRVYIADGHHRLAAALNTGIDDKWISTIYVPDDEMEIAPYHRLLALAGTVDFTGILDKLQVYFNISQVQGNLPYRPEKKNVFGFFIDHTWFRIELKPAFSEMNLPDACFLQDKVLNGIFGLKKSEDDCRLEVFSDTFWDQYIHRLSGSGHCAGFTLYPISSHELFTRADSNVLLPPKSTWIEPKVPLGALVHLKQGNNGRGRRG
ncbi:DUF1015 family protein [Pedobacter miscanthi]|uniref:DUF1015 domain-containing protein n=1 Tax=Pedobacter miscanthi TaxID=2259170 RepID=A0A366L2Y7_9SPHI|nr:DUF1015 family protein [Pedobacter miscanthi]RBQ07853.1 hypothetical protein DRW42_09620 [Pedobacter miscanthi]